MESNPAMRLPPWSNELHLAMRLCCNGSGRIFIDALPRPTCCILCFALVIVLVVELVVVQYHGRNLEHGLWLLVHRLDFILEVELAVFEVKCTVQLIEAAVSRSFTM